MFTQHSRRIEKRIRDDAKFFVRCMDRPSDPGKLMKIPHVIQMECASYASAGITLYEFELTLSNTFVFVQNLKHKYNVQLNPSEADLYLFLDLVLDYIVEGLGESFKRSKIFITSAIPHFTEIAAIKGFRVTPRVKHDGGVHSETGWRAFKWV